MRDLKILGEGREGFQEEVVLEPRPEAKTKGSSVKREQKSVLDGRTSICKIPKASSPGGRLSQEFLVHALEHGSLPVAEWACSRVASILCLFWPPASVWLPHPQHC